MTLDDDVAAAIDKLRRERRLGLSEAINELIRAGIRAPRPQRRFRLQSRNMGLKVDVTNVAEAIEILEGPQARS